MRAYRCDAVEKGILDTRMRELYGTEALDEQRDRYILLLEGFRRRYDRDEAFLFSSPGRSELCGNHTDHNCGKVLAAGIHLDKIAAAVPRDDQKVEIVTRGFSDDICVDLSSLEPDSTESGKADALVRGVASYLQAGGYKTGGFSAFIDSRVAMGSGLSSSASLEVLIGMIFNSLYNRGRIEAVELAKAGKYAENLFFHKPCGLMDQIACAVGGITMIDFKEEDNPLIENLTCDFRKHGYQLMILDTGADHADLTAEYASIPREMRCLSRILGADVLRQSSLEDLIRQAPKLRKECGDRAVLRGLHFFRENERVAGIPEALASGDFETYLKIIAESGSSSSNLLQNCIPSGGIQNQAVSYALGLLHTLCPEGVFRVHGGGFAGTIQGYIPVQSFDTIRDTLRSHFGKDGVTALSIRSSGVIHIGEE